MSITLDKFITNLSKFNKAPMKVIQKEVIEIIFLILNQMATYTIVDTTTARSLIIQKFADKYGYDTQHLYKEIYNFWNKSTRRSPIKNRDSSNLSTELTNYEFLVNIAIKDHGLFAQENATNGLFKGKEYPSSTAGNLTGRDNSKFKTRHLTYVQDLINSGNFNEIEGLNYEKIVDSIVKRIESELIK